MTSLADRLDESTSGNVFDRRFFRHPQSGAVIIRLPDERKMWGGAPSARYKNHLENTYNLQRWSERMTLTGTFELMVRGELDALPDDLTTQDAKRLLDGLVGEAKDAAGALLAADRGTHGHLLSELNDEGAAWLDHLEAGEDLGLDHGLQAAIVEAWRRLVAEHKLEILAVEQTVVSITTETAGTLDRIARTTEEMWFQTAGGRNVLVPVGTVLVLDVKTGKIEVRGKDRQPSYWDGYCLQIYCYATGVPVTINPDDEDDVEWGEWPFDVSTEHALIAHIDIARALETGVVEARLIYVDLTQAVEMESAVRAVREARKLKPFGKVDLEPSVRVQALTDVPYLEVVDWLKWRMEAIRVVPEAKADLLRYWPKEIPAPGKGIAPSDVDTVVELLDRIEAKHQIAFGAPDPRAPKTGHASEMRERAHTQLPEGGMP